MELHLVKREFVGIEYPCKVENVDKAIRTLGGKKSITKVYNDPQRRLELWFRPDDPYCSMVCGDRHNVPSLVIKVKRRKKKNAILDDSKNECPYEYKAEVIGTVNTVFKFTCMANFQYLPVKSIRQEDGKVKYESLLEKLVIPGIVSSDWLKQQTEVFLPPPIFSRLDTPTYYNYRENTNQTVPREVEGKTVIGHARQRRFHHAHFLNYEEPEVPKEPYPGLLDQVLKEYKDSFEQVKRLFDEERPIWSKNALMGRVNVRREQYKRILPSLSFYWLTGPWRSLWCKFGYDPRKDPSAKIYQTIDFRVRGRGAFDMHAIKPKRSTYIYTLPTAVVRTGSNLPPAVIETSTLSTEDNQVKEDPEIIKKQKEARYICRPGVLPPFRQMFYQALDIKFDEAQELIHSNDGKEKPCTEVDGWLIPNTAATIREMIYKSLEDILGPSMPSDKYIRDNSVKVKKYQPPKKGKVQQKSKTTKSKRRKEESSSEDSVSGDSDDIPYDDDDDDDDDDAVDEEVDDNEEQNEMVTEILQYMQDSILDTTAGEGTSSALNQEDSQSAAVDTSQDSQS